MYVKVTFLILLSRFPLKISASGVCTPNSQSLLNGKICKCNITGHWSESDCYPIARRQVCKPGQVIKQGCSRCVCQETGQLSCTEDSSCTGPITHQNVHETLASVLPWCNPFRTYYINCNICICSATGKTSEARCALDISCTLFKEPSTVEIASNKNTCIPKVMYLFPCLHCLCSDDGHFNLDKCVETCVRKQVDTSRRCIPNTLYRNDCNVCLCPNSSIPDNKHCTNKTCTLPVQFGYLRTLRSKQMKCTPYSFIKPRCIYCDCNHDGVVDEKTCLELPCLESEELKHEVVRETCSPGEIVSFCIECLCPRSGATSDEYCSNTCSYPSKLSILEKIMTMPKDKHVIDNDAIKRETGNDACKPDTIYYEHDRYCLCPETGNSNFNLCTSEEKSPGRNSSAQYNGTGEFYIAIDFNMTCEPSTFVEFECNTCFCSKQGKIDPKWCTYDDCESKRIIKNSHTAHQDGGESEAAIRNIESASNTCNPGSISHADCNFCICPESGFIEERVCSKTDCSTFAKPPLHYDKFTCDPLTYFEVDCNICFCPRDGKKNVAKCTKNHCENNFLRTNICVPGELFSDECNVCVCPPNGNKADKACTNYTCVESVPWKKIFQLSESLIGGNQITEDSTRNLDLCFPGEEFVIGCKICVCPDMGLRIYATCSPTFCEEERQSEAQELSGTNRDVTLYRKLHTRREDCMILNFTNQNSRVTCTPGAMYIIRCKQCICPYMGDSSVFCRPLPDDFYCEQPFPGYNYVPMGRRTEDSSNMTVIDQANSTKIGNETVLATINHNITITPFNSTKPILVPHEHTRYECKTQGQISDECFVCECDGETLIAEHCFQSNSTQCTRATPSFLIDYVKSSNSTEKNLAKD